MPFRIGWPELLIVLLIIMILFGGRLTKSAGELAKGIKIFQKTMKEDDDDDDDDDGNVVKEETKKKEE
ncbi:MAG: twin-arginine translocase TatA/TatE family subunit [Chloroflexi bacterium]|nr:twin-arginine translocase TatA/TatE family subunit [Chloroflexota bacterium]